MQHPIHHIILMRFLAGSANEFFTKAEALIIPEHLPFGEPPYPCRNIVCEYYLRGVIEKIDIYYVKSEAKATFTCPCCGFSYRRKGNVPKEKQYHGQIDIIDYGYKWYDMLNAMLETGASVNKISKTLGCDTRSVTKFGIELGFFSSNEHIQFRPAYVPVGDSGVKRPDFNEKREIFRQRWLNLAADNPNALRNELMKLDSKSHSWLCTNDKDWYEKNSPESKKGMPRWDFSDDEYAERIGNAINEIRDAPGKPYNVPINLDTILKK